MRTATKKAPVKPVKKARVRKVEPVVEAPVEAKTNGFKELHEQDGESRPVAILDIRIGGFRLGEISVLEFLKNR